jgi:hypothetical protein
MGRQPGVYLALMSFQKPQSSFLKTRELKRKYYERERTPFQVK